MEKEKLKMNLQMFAKEDEDDSGKEDNLDEGGKNESDDSSLPKDEKELQKIIDNAVETRLARQKEKTEEKIRKIKEKAKSDAQAYADMSESEKEKAKLEERMKEIEKREKEINDRELLGNIKETLMEKELPVVFADSLIKMQDNEKIQESIKEIKRAWDEELAEAVKASVRQDTPSASSRSYADDSGKPKSKAEFFNAGRKID